MSTKRERMLAGTAAVRKMAEDWDRTMQTKPYLRKRIAALEAALRKAILAGRGLRGYMLSGHLEVIAWDQAAAKAKKVLEP